MIDRRPGVMVRPTDAVDVMTAVDFAREYDLLVAVKGAGHNVSSNAVCDGGLMINFAHMLSVQDNPTTKTVRVRPGAKLGDLDHETVAFSLVTLLTWCRRRVSQD